MPDAEDGVTKGRGSAHGYTCKHVEQRERANGSAIDRQAIQGYADRC